MARKRDIVIGVVIVGAFLMVFGFMGIMFIGVMTGDGDAGFSSLGGGSIGVIPMFGVMDEYSCRPVIDYVDRWAENNSIKAIVIHINSPGGGTAISQELHDAIKRASQEKPVVAAMSEVAASGGYYIACAADRIVANPGTLTGSIGTIMSFTTYEGLMDKIGIGSETIKSGEFKDVGNYSRQMTDKEELMLQAVVMDGYEQFVEAVAEGRGMDREEVYNIADGSLFTGLQAYNLGLVDTLGGLTQAIELAEDMAEIERDSRIVTPRQRRESVWTDLLTGVLGGLGKQIGASNDGPKLMYLYR